MKRNRVYLKIVCFFIIASCCQVGAYVEHLAVRIDGDNAFAEYFLQGKGTSNDPYIIENLEIKSSTGRAGIHISHTTAFFVIRNCYIHDQSIYNRGIELSNVSNGTIKNCIIERVGYVGVHIADCEDITVINNTIKKNTDGGLVEVYNSSGIAIERNNLEKGGKDNVLVANPYRKGVSIINNQLIGGGISDDGVDVYVCNMPITSEGITYLGVKTNLLIKGNYMSGHYSKGVEFNGSSVNGVIVAENIFDGDIFSEDGSLGNGCEHKDALIVRNTFKNGARILIYYGENFKMYENNFLDNTRIDDTGTNNFWYDVNRKRGNYWQECTIPDNNGDGIRDGSYSRYGDYTKSTVMDLYPLVAEFNNTVPNKLLCDFGQKGQEVSDGKIDFEDLLWFAVYWNAKDIRGDIAGSITSGQPPDLVTQSDGKVDFEDLMIFMQMWNWWHRM